MGHHGHWGDLPPICLCCKRSTGRYHRWVASRSAENAHEFAQTHGVAKAFDRYEDLIADPDLDIVYVGTPDVVHKAHTLLALEAGKHVLCEKALATTVRRCTGNALLQSSRT